MAKKTSKKKVAKAKGSSKKAGRSAPASKKAGKKSPAVKSGARAKAGAGKRSASQASPFPVSTGKGLTPAQMGQDLVDMFNRGELSQIEDRFWSPDIVSVEGMGMAWAGRKAVDEKNRSWMQTHRMHGASAEGPFVGASGFAVKFRMDVEDTTTGDRAIMHEVGVYTVMDGKIVREEFMYGPVTKVIAATLDTEHNGHTQGTGEDAPSITTEHN